MNRPEKLSGHTHRQRTGCGNLYVTVNIHKGTIDEVFVRLGKAGGCASSQTETLGRLITLAVRAGVPVSELVKQLSGIGCHQPAFAGEGKRNLSCADAVSNALRGYIEEVEETKEPVKVVHKVDQVPKVDHDKIVREVKAIVSGRQPTSCPDCGSTLAMEEGCLKCHSCGYTKC